MVAFFLSKVDSGHRSSDLRCIQQEAEDSVESEALFKYKFKSLNERSYYLFCKDNSFFVNSASLIELASNHPPADALLLKGFMVS